MKISNELSDKAILIELGQRIQNQRIFNNITQTAIAKQTGLSRSSIIRLEKGIPVTVDCLISVMRALQMLDNLEITFPEQEIHPMELINNRGKQRLRASKRHVPKKDDAAAWRWGDEL